MLIADTTRIVPGRTCWQVSYLLREFSDVRVLAYIL